MIKSHKGRDLPLGLLVFVYFNVHKHCFSIKALEGPCKGKVVAHTTSLCLENCHFKVNEKRRQKVIEERVKNVHAGIVGKFTKWEKDVEEIGGEEVVYNPYLYKQFVHKQTKKSVISANRVWLDQKKVYMY